MIIATRRLFQQPQYYRVSLTTFIPIRFKICMGKHTFIYAATVLWSKLTTHLIQIQAERSFKLALKNGFGIQIIVFLHMIYLFIHIFIPLLL